jgi:hypothetical protein
MGLLDEMDFPADGTRSRFSLLSFRYYASILPNRPFAAALPFPFRSFIHVSALSSVVVFLRAAGRM